MNRRYNRVYKAYSKCSKFLTLTVTPEHNGTTHSLEKKRGGGGRKGGEKREGGEGKTLFSTIFVARSPYYCSGP